MKLTFTRRLSVWLLLRTSSCAGMAPAKRGEGCPRWGLPGIPAAPERAWRIKLSSTRHHYVPKLLLLQSDER